MTRLIAVARVRNEDDIIEAFVRHHAALVDRLILLDNASNDRTPEILRALKDEGLPLTLYRCDSVTFVESAHNTFLFRQAASLGADWVLCLDADEFVDTSRLSVPLSAHLAGIPAEVACVQVQMTNFHPTRADDATEVNVPRRLLCRSLAPNGALKVFARGNLARTGVTVAHGNHELVHNHRTVVGWRDESLMLAHFPMRTGWQMLAKAIVGRLKVLASGEAEESRQTAVHYTDLLHNLYHHPEWLLDDRDFLQGQRPPEFFGADAIADPLQYLGGDLLYTQPTDPRLQATRSLLASLEALARRHGALLDVIAAAADMTNARDSEVVQVF